LADHLDKQISVQLSVILQHKSLQRLEGTWRGLHYLVSSSPQKENVKVRVLNLSKEDLVKAVSPALGSSWDQCVSLLLVGEIYIH
jgi:type VI secretion system protein ImpC